MQLTNIGGYRSIKGYIYNKLAQYTKEEKSFKTLFSYMFSENDNTMAETSDGYRIKKLTYGEVKSKILHLAPSLKRELGDLPSGSTVGIYMGNSVRWLEVFWAILLLGYNPLLMNLRLNSEMLEEIIAEHNVLAVISDEKEFSVKTVNATALEYDDDGYDATGAFGTEVIFMSSGTSNKVKLCAYTAENFYYQICDSVRIVENCPKIIENYNGEIKQLTLLPFYHVFGFIAVYLWFGFFSRSFVFLKDLNPATLLSTIRKHNVTHIFAVPLVWDTIHREAMRKIRAKGEKTYNKFQKALKLFNSWESLGTKLATIAFSEVRDNLFGDSVKFLISGGSPISRRTLNFFNGIGYHITNGYGMTEIGITSVETTAKKKILNSATIGRPFGYTEYSINESGELLVRGKTMASRITVGNETSVTNFDEWFNTNDIARCEDGRYYLDGRRDDLIICENGENLNPVLVEGRLKTAGCDSVCLFADKDNVPTLIASISRSYSNEKLRETVDSLTLAIRNANLENEIKKIVLTPDPLMDVNEFKISRRRVAMKYSDGGFRVINLNNPDDDISEMISELECEVRECFALALERSVEEVSPTASFFVDLGGSSLDYFTLLNLIKAKFNLSTPISENEGLYTVRDFCGFIMKN